VDVAAWLHGLGLEQYELAFCANEIDASLLPSPPAGDLNDLGVTLVGHRSSSSGRWQAHARALAGLAQSG
jgi:SAM domain (Sterile alpha motif)